jgi:molecular chaperone GrpE
MTEHRYPPQQPDAAERPGAAGQEPEVDLTGTVAELEARVAELHDRYLRTAAELDNVRKRTAREAERQRVEERARVAAEWLPVLDNLELALHHAEADPAALLDGVRAVRDQALGVLTRLGFPRQAEVGVGFDPAKHEAVSAVPDPASPAGTVVEVVRPGYGNDERQLRPASVVVSTGAP